MFEWFYITSQGKSLLAKAQVGEPIIFTKAKMGSGELKGGQNIERVAELIAPVMDLPLSDAKAAGDVLTVTVQVANEKLSHATWFREIGLFARDENGGEILYAYGNAGSKADYIPAPTEGKVEYILALNCAVGNAAQVTIEEQESLVFVTQKDVIALTKGGTGATGADAARENLNAAAKEHAHSAADIGAGTLSTDRLPVIPAAKGGTGRTDGKASLLATARNIGVSGGATGTATAFDGSGDITIPITGLDVDKVSAGILLAGRGGTGRSDGKAMGLAAAKLIGLSGGATGTATAFDGSANITIPVTALDVGTATKGTLSVERGGTGRTDGKVLGLATARTIGISGGATGTATGFDGSANVTIPVTALDMDKAAAAGVLPIARGGTGVNNAVAARKAMKIQCGYVSQALSSIATNAQITVDVVFPTEFLSAPIVVVSPHSTASGRMNGLVMNVSNRTTVGFSVDIYNATSGASGAFTKGFYWIAIEN